MSIQHYCRYEICHVNKSHCDSFICIKALIERGDEAVKQPVDDEENTFLHIAARSGAFRSIKVSKN